MFLLFGRELQTTLHDPNSQISRTLDVLRTAVRPVCRQPVQNFSLGMSKRGAADQHGRDYYRYTLPHRDLSYLLRITLSAFYALPNIPPSHIAIPKPIY